MRKPMKFKRYEGGGDISGESNSKEPEDKRSFLERMKSDFSRITAGNIDDPKSEAYKKYGADANNRSQIVSRRRPLPPMLSPMPSPNDESGYLQNMISSGSDIKGRPQDEGYRPNAGTARERAMAEGAFDSGKIIENTGPRNPEAIMEADNPRKTAPKPTPPKPSASKTGSKIESSPKAPAYVQRYTEEMMEADNPRSVKAEKAPAEKAKPAAPPPSAPKASSSRVPTPEQASANRAAAAEKVKGMGSSVVDYFSNLETPAKRKAREQKEKAAKGSYASGGSVSSASRRADGIATKGKTRGRMC